jgi:hypothetical protein
VYSREIIRKLLQVIETAKAIHTYMHNPRQDPVHANGRYLLDNLECWLSVHQNGSSTMLGSYQ